MQRTWDKHRKAWSFKLPGGATSGAYIGVSKAHAGLVYNLYVNAHKCKRYMNQEDFLKKKVHGCSSLESIGSTRTVIKTVVVEGKEYSRKEIVLNKDPCTGLAYHRLRHLRRAYESRRKLKNEDNC